MGSMSSSRWTATSPTIPQRCRGCSRRWSWVRISRSGVATCLVGRSRIGRGIGGALSKWGNRYAAAVLGIDVRDATSGYRAYRASALSKIDFQSVRADGYGFQIEMAHRVLATGSTVVELPISFIDRVRGTSKMSGRIVVEALVLVTWWGLRDRVLRIRR